MTFHRLTIPIAQQLMYVIRLCDIEYVGIDNDWGEITHFQFQQFWLNRKSIIWLMKILSFRVQASSNQRHARPFSDYASPFKAGMLSLMYLVIAQALSVLNTSSTLCHRLPACKLFFPREKVCKQAIVIAKEIKEMSQLSGMVVCVCYTHDKRCMVLAAHGLV